MIPSPALAAEDMQRLSLATAMPPPVAPQTPSVQAMAGSSNSFLAIVAGVEQAVNHRVKGTLRMLDAAQGTPGLSTADTLRLQASITEMGTRSIFIKSCADSIGGAVRQLTQGG